MVAARYYYSPQTSSAPDAGWKIIVSSKFWAKNSTKICAQSFSFRRKGKTESWHWPALKTRASPAQWSGKVQLVMPTNTVVQYWEVLYFEKVSTWLGLLIRNSDICYWAFRRIQKSVLALDCSSGNSHSKTLVLHENRPTWDRMIDQKQLRSPLQTRPELQDFEGKNVWHVPALNLLWALVLIRTSLKNNPFEHSSADWLSCTQAISHEVLRN